MSAVRFDRVVASMDGHDVAVAFFCGENPSPVALTICNPGAARELLKEVSSALDAGISEGLIEPDV